MNLPSLAALLEERRILVVVGTGGVGKTTVAAALAVEAARRGRRVLALTIDPARRLSDALGLERPGDETPGETQTLPPTAEAQLGIALPGRLDTMMLDMKSTFDGLVDRFAEGEETKARILENRIYQLPRGAPKRPFAFRSAPRLRVQARPPEGRGSREASSTRACPRRRCSCRSRPTFRDR